VLVEKRRGKREKEGKKERNKAKETTHGTSNQGMFKVIFTSPDGRMGLVWQVSERDQWEAVWPKGGEVEQGQGRKAKLHQSCSPATLQPLCHFCATFCPAQPLPKNTKIYCPNHPDGPTAVPASACTSWGSRPICQYVTPNPPPLSTHAALQVQLLKRETVASMLSHYCGSRLHSMAAHAGAPCTTTQKPMVQIQYTYQCPIESCFS
jgi:hypothetical protein